MKKSKTMELKKPVRVSLSRQVLTAMESMIRSGKWKVGDRIPAEAELARAFSVSHNTIREALGQHPVEIVGAKIRSLFERN